SQTHISDLIGDCLGLGLVGAVFCDCLHTRDLSRCSLAVVRAVSSLPTGSQGQPEVRVLSGWLSCLLVV
ncbi:MAG: hypothetical protein ACRC2U_14475, partial [Aeromonas sp.]